MNKEKFIEELESKISEVIEMALEYAKKVKDGNDKTNILNIEYLIESPYEYHYQKIDVLDVKKMLGE